MVEQRQATVVIADDMGDIRALLRMVLERDGRFEVVAEAEDGDKALELLREHQPDFVTLDLHMDGMSDLSLLGEARDASPTSAVVIVTGTYHPDRDPDLDRVDIAGWFTKDQIMTDLPDRLLELKQT